MLGDVSRVGDSVLVIYAQEHARDALGAGGLSHDLDAEFLCECDGVYRKRGDAPLFDDFLRSERGREVKIIAAHPPFLPALFSSVRE